MNIYTRSLNDAFKGFRLIASSVGTRPAPVAPQTTINLDDLPSKPKRPAVGWNRFVNQKKSQLQGNPANNMKELAAKWNTMTKSERAPYEDAAQKEMSAYRVQLKKYNDVMNQTVPMSEMVKMLNLATKKQKKVRVSKGKSGWNLFMIDVMAKDRPLLSNGKPDLSAIGKRWNQLSDSQKQAYNDRARHQA